MNVNLSATQLRQPDLAARSLAAIEQSGVDAADLCLEITEHSSIRTDVSDFASTLGRAGVRFALDDFGTSCSNLSHLSRLPVTTLKIDRSFVAGLARDTGDASLVRAVLSIADALGLGAVAEGIETAEQRAALVALGCAAGQGYLLSRPVPADQATALLVSGRRLARVGRDADRAA
jgi:EAL domain-containing protein (putative c-di-GMP-specific phosphodiesterase class I)